MAMNIQTFVLDATPFTKFIRLCTHPAVYALLLGIAVNEFAVWLGVIQP